MCQVVNKYKVNMKDLDIVYIGRGSVFGNPHEMLDRSDAERDRGSNQLGQGSTD